MSQAGQEVVFLCLTKAAWCWLVTCHLAGKDRKLYSFACDMWISAVTWSVLACLSSGEAWKLVSRASVKGLLLSSGTVVHGSISEDRGLDSPPASPDGNPVEDIERAVASEWTRVEDTYGLERPLHGESLVYIHRQTTQRMAISHESREPISVSREEFPDLILEDIAIFFADIYVQWREVSWWVCRIHHTSAASALPILSAPNYVVVTERDYEAFSHRPFGLVELVFGSNSHVFATCLPRWMNWRIVRTFLEPITPSGHFDIQMRGLLNGEGLDRRLVRCYDGFFVQVFISASPLVLIDLAQNAPLVADTLHTAGSFPFSERTLRTIVYIARGYSLILSRCFVTEAPPTHAEVIQGLKRRFPDLAMENIGLAEVHPSMHTINPVAHPGTLCYVVTPAEEDHLVYVALELHLPPYHHVGSISVPPRLSKIRLIAQTGISIVCGPTGELCLCYLNGWELSTAQDERVYDGDFVICWLDQDGESSARIQLADDSLPGLNGEAHVVGNGTENCDPHRVADNRQ